MVSLRYCFPSIVWFVCLFVFLPCSEVLSLCFELTSNHIILILPITAACQAPCLHGGPQLPNSFSLQYFSTFWMRQIFLVQDAHHLAFLQMLVIPHDMVTAKKMGRGNPNKTPTHFQMSAGAINAPSVESATHINDLSDSIDSSFLHFSFIYSFINNAPRGLWDLSSLTRD